MKVWFINYWSLVSNNRLIGDFDTRSIRTVLIILIIPIIKKIIFENQFFVVKFFMSRTRSKNDL